jgi:hypothetical protein
VNPRSTPAGQGPDDGAPLLPAERAELERLRREVAAARAVRARSARRPGRTVPAVVLIVVACLLAPLSVVAVWTHDFVVDTDRYVATVGPLADDPAVQGAVTDRVTTLVAQQLDLPARVAQVAEALPGGTLGAHGATALNALSGPIVSGITGFIHSAVAKVVASSAFATVWTGANRTVHSSVVKALTGQGGGTVQLSGNDVTIDLAPVIAQVRTQLVDSGFGLAASIPTVHTSFTVASSGTVPKVRTGFRLLEIAGNWLPIATVVVAAAGVLLAVRRRTALIGAGIGIAAGMLVLGIGLAVGRTIAIGKLPADVSEPAAVAVIDAVLHFLRQTLRTVAVLGVVVAFGAYVDGPTRSAVWIRGACVSGIGEVRRLASRAGLDPGPAGRWVHRHRAWPAWTVLGVAALVFALWDHPTVAVVVWTAVIVLLALGVIEFLDPGEPAHPDGG